MVGQSAGSGSLEEVVVRVRRWASQLTAEDRQLINPEYYVWPRAVKKLGDELADSMYSRLVALVGQQGVGKTSALMALRQIRFRKGSEESGGVVFFKWRRESQLFLDLLSGRHECSAGFLEVYRSRLLEELRNAEGDLKWGDRERIWGSRSADVTVEWAERRLGRRVCDRLRAEVWMSFLVDYSILFVDTPDYSRRDRRAMARDLMDIQWFWHACNQNRSLRPRMVLAVQKEMVLSGNFFLDKMVRVDLEPLEAGELVEAYVKQFSGPEPFTREALLVLAGMSRGVFRRFLRYISLALDAWELQGRRPERVDVGLVRGAVGVERISEDMELELSEPFPRDREFRVLAVRVLLWLGEVGTARQQELLSRFGVEESRLSRLLERLELHRYISRERHGADKIVSLTHPTL